MTIIISIIAVIILVVCLWCLSQIIAPRVWHRCTGCGVYLTQYGEHQVDRPYGVNNDDCEPILCDVCHFRATHGRSPLYPHP